MMRLALLALLVVLNIAVAAPLPFTRHLSKRSIDLITPYPRPLQCPVYSCVNTGQSCGTSQTATTFTRTDCNGDAVCNITSSSQSNLAGTCITTPRAGQSCAGTRECVDGYVCHAVSKTCVPDSTPEFGPGAACNQDNQCSFLELNGNRTKSCVGGRCKFVPDMGRCLISGLQCNTLTSFCNSSDNLCHTQLAEGAACDLQLAESGCKGSCLPTTVNSTTGTCRSRRFAQAGQACRFDLDCNEGLLCGLPQNAKYGICNRVASTATLHKPCATNRDCSVSNNEYCGCNSIYGSTPVCLVDVVPSGYTAAYDNLETCASSLCSLTNGDFDSACVIRQCVREFCLLANITSTVSDAFTSDCYLKNTLLPLCASNPQSNPTSIPGTTSRGPSTVAPESSSPVDPGNPSTVAPGNPSTVAPGNPSTVAPTNGQTNSTTPAIESPDSFLLSGSASGLKAPVSFLVLVALIAVVSL